MASASLRTIGLSMKNADWANTPQYSITEFFTIGRVLNSIPDGGSFLSQIELVKVHARSLEDFQNLRDGSPASQLMKIREVKVDTETISIVMANLHGPFFRMLRSLENVWPISPTNWEKGSGILVTVYGEQPTLRTLAKRSREIMKTNKRLFTLSSPKTEFFVEEIPDRRRETVKTAISMGYYEYPRRCTQRDIADRLSLKQATVSEHLQRGEMSIMTSWSDTM